MYSKTTQKNTERLRQILENLERGLNWLQSDRVSICIPALGGSQAYANQDGKRITPITKDCGSLLQVLESGVNKLASFIVDTSRP